MITPHFVRRLLVLLVVGLVQGSSVSLLAGGQDAPPTAPGPSAVVDNGELMELLFEPLYDELKRSLQEPPRDRKEWAAIYRAAVKLAEASNLLFFRSPNRATSDPRWAPLVAAARGAASDVAAATFVALRNVRSKDLDAIRAVYPAVAESCNACHRALAPDVPTLRP